MGILAHMRFHHVAVISLLALAAGCRTPAPAVAEASPSTEPLVAATTSSVAQATPVATAPASAASSSAAGAVADASSADAALLARLSALAPQADRGVLALALAARECAVASGEVEAGSRLAVIDYSLPSTTRRLWVFDVAGGKLLHHELVAHGSGSGEN